MPSTTNTTNTASLAPHTGTELATLGGGCFWCLEAIFQQVRGILSVTSGYCGGHLANPSYADICTGDTQHAEVVQICFDPQKITYPDLLEIFFSIHDPSTLNQQGHDIGSQYRSVIFTHTSTQAACANAYIATLKQNTTHPIVTEVCAITTFYPAEDEHQNYFTQHRQASYCQAVIFPKLAKFMHQFRERTRYG